ncbi:MAG: tRNA pseudouridine(38-40) synthase TruA [Polyangiaceae bacterium]|nr:tRNA pseudouridine(38-40) synthase TruA [Polyangiaceae bacterium]
MERRSCPIDASALDPEDGSPAGHRMESGPENGTTQRGVLLTVAYDGQDFHGLARQPGIRTVAGQLDAAVRAIDPDASPVRALSRTDAGVHARAQMVAFDTRRAIPSRGWVLALTRNLPKSMGVLRASRVPSGFDPRDHVVTKTYSYLLFPSPVRDPLLVGRAWRIGEPLDVELMRTELGPVAGTHDFAAFRNASDGRLNTHCRIARTELRTWQRDQRCLEVVLEGDRFLHRMVRIIVGTLVDVGRGWLSQNAVKSALAGGSRATLGMTAPPDGLYLEQVTLADCGQDAWPESVLVDARSTLA